MTRLSLALIAGLSTAAFAQIASAADLPTKAPIVPVAPAAFSWTGFYVGATIGYGWRTVDNTFAVFQTADIAIPPISFAANDSLKLHGVIGGIEAGYNWQVRNFVFGIETDFSASDIKGSHDFIGSFRVPIGLGPQQSVIVSDNSHLRWLGTTRGRIGYANDQWLIFASGGVAYGEVEVNGVAQLPLQVAGPPSFNAPWTWNNSKTKVGWAVGAGAEYALTRNFTLKAEYLYVDLGDVTANVSGGVGSFVGSPGNCYADVGVCGQYANPASGPVTTHFAINIARFGMNYKF
jgi:outer membrane immunogenic protein